MLNFFDEKISRDGVCVQIGLGMHAEYLYLTGAFVNNNPIKNIPENIHYDNWEYYGVDGDPSSIHVMIENYNTIENARWVLGYVNIDDNAFITLYSPHSYYLSGYEKATYYTMQSTTLNSLFNGLGIQHIDVLAMDIEGMEFPIFSNYDWIIKPSFIAVEDHSQNKSELINVIESNGYKNTLDLYDDSQKTTELQFIRI